MHVSIPQCPPPPPPGIHPVLDILANVCNWLPQGQNLTIEESTLQSSDATTVSHHCDKKYIARF